MEPRNEIAMELSAISEPVAQLMRATGRQAPYTVPAGYFDRLPEMVLGRISAASPTFQVPPGYFDGLAGQVLSRIRAAEGAAGNEKSGAVQGFEDVRAELAGISTLVAGIARETPYRLPAGYFDEVSPILAVLREVSAYQVPQDYFDSLSPVLTVARPNSGYQIPVGYFEAFPAEMMAKVAGADAMEQAKVVPIGRRAHWDNPLLRWKYAAAAAVAACLLLIFSWPQSSRHEARKGPAVADIPQALQRVSDQELMAYLDDQHTFVADPATDAPASLDMNEGEIKDLLGNVSDSDLQQYVEQHGKAEDIATN